VKHHLVIHEGAQAEESVQNIVEVDLATYEVTAPQGLFKRGKAWKKGSKIQLDIQTAERFIANGEIKEIKQ
jgi:hypothetical protein